MTYRGTGSGAAVGDRRNPAVTLVRAWSSKISRASGWSLGGKPSGSSGSGSCNAGLSIAIGRCPIGNMWTRNSATTLSRSVRGEPSGGSGVGEPGLIGGPATGGGGPAGAGGAGGSGYGGSSGDTACGHGAGLPEGGVGASSNAPESVRP